MPTQSGSIRLFRFSGIDVFLHWSWFLVAVYEVQAGGIGHYPSRAWSVAEYLALFVIVLLHEFGHALACRSVGGEAKRIVLWPLGGVAYVSPPPRPGATLWSIVAGPLVNVALLPVLLGIGYALRAAGVYQTVPEIHELVRAIAYINIILLIFNILPIYPLDGGKILWSLLWFVLGRARALMAATVIGLIGIAGVFLLAIVDQSFWLGFLGVYMLVSCWGGLQAARALLKLSKAPRRQGYACPSCHVSPPVGNNWRCSICKQTFDTFDTGAQCPYCLSRFPNTQCFECGSMNPIMQWASVPQPVVEAKPIG